MNFSIVEPTELVSLTRCPRQWYYRYQKGLRRRDVDPKLFLGTAVHQGLDAYYNSWEPDVGLEKYNQYIEKTELEITRTAPNFGPEEYTKFKEAANLGRAILINYFSEAPQLDEDLIGEVVTTEQPWEIPMDNLEITLAGRFDMVIRDQWGRTEVWDHKTAKSFLKPELLRKDLQMQLYSLASQYLYQLGSTKDTIVSGVRVNQLRKSNPSTARAALVKRDLIPSSNWALEKTEMLLRHLIVLRDYMEVYGETVCYPDMSCTWACRYVPICEVWNAGGDTRDIINELYVEDLEPNYLREDDE